MNDDELTKKLHATTDAMVWAEEFVRTIREIGERGLSPDEDGRAVNAQTAGAVRDVGFMVSWFANAIETGRAAGVVRGAPQPDGFTRERLDLAKRALIEDGYFTPDQVGDDIAPRITEALTAARAELAALRDSLPSDTGPHECCVQAADLISELAAERANGMDVAARLDAMNEHNLDVLSDTRAELAALQQRIRALAMTWERREANLTSPWMATELRAALAGAAPAEEQR